MDPYRGDREFDVPTELIDVRKFTEAWGKTADDCFPLVLDRRDPDIRSFMDVSRQRAGELARLCDPASLCGSESKDVSQFLTTFPEDTQLISVKLQQMDVRRRRTDGVYKRLVGRRMKYKVLDSLMTADLTAPAAPPGDRQIALPDSVLQVQVYRPYRHCRKNSRLSMDHIFLVLSRQKLTELRDRIRCVNDFLVTGDYSENPDLDANVCAKDVFRSGFFFIEDVFYNDMREPDCRDYSEVLTRWARDSARGVGPFQSRSMTGVTFKDLKIRLGHPYLYSHQGDCEHLLIFSDIRMVHPDDPQDITAYPYMVRRPSRKRTVCKVCGINSARWITHNDMLAPETPCFFCDTCFTSLHYDSQGRKIGDFSAYKYYDSHTVL